MFCAVNACLRIGKGKRILKDFLFKNRVDLFQAESSYFNLELAESHIEVSMGKYLQGFCKIFLNILFVGFSSYNPSAAHIRPEGVLRQKNVQSKQV